MCLKKFTIGLALSSIVASGVIQTANLTEQPTKINTTKLRALDDYNPFNQSTLAYSISNQEGDLYAYYVGDVFPGQWETPRFGFQLSMSEASMHRLIQSYQGVKNNQNGVMLSYLTGPGAFLCPYPCWVYHEQYTWNASKKNNYVFDKSFASGPSGEAMIQDAINNKQTITFFFELELDRSSSHPYWGRVIEANINTGQNITAAWYHKIHKI